MAFQGLASRTVERFFRHGRLPKGAGWAGVARIVARKLDMLAYAEALTDLHRVIVHETGANQVQQRRVEGPVGHTR